MGRGKYKIDRHNSYEIERKNNNKWNEIERKNNNIWNEIERKNKHNGAKYLYQSINKKGANLNSKA